MSSSLFVMIFALATIGCAIGMAVSAHQKKIGYSVLFGALTFLLGLLTSVGMFDLGLGRVPPTLKLSVLSERLETGVAYQFLASSNDGNGQVILVKKTGTSDFYALRVKEVPPAEFFTLGDGKPVAIAAPTPPVGAK